MEKTLRMAAIIILLVHASIAASQPQDPGSAVQEIDEMLSVSDRQALSAYLDKLPTRALMTSGAAELRAGKSEIAYGVFADEIRQRAHKDETEEIFNLVLADLSDGDDQARRFALAVSGFLVERTTPNQREAILEQINSLLRSSGEPSAETLIYSLVIGGDIVAKESDQRSPESGRFFQTVNRIMVDDMEDLQVRRTAIKAARRLGVGNSRQELVNLVRDRRWFDTPEIMRSTVLAVAQLGEPGLTDEIVTVLRETANSQVHGSAILALGDLRHSGAIRPLVLHGKRFGAETVGIAARYLYDEIWLQLVEGSDQERLDALELSRYVMNFRPDPKLGQSEQHDVRGHLLDLVRQWSPHTEAELALEILRPTLTRDECQLLSSRPDPLKMPSEVGRFLEARKNAVADAESVPGDVPVLKGLLVPSAAKVDLHQEYGDPGYRHNSFSWAALGWLGHAGMYAGMNSSNVKKIIEVGSVLAPVVVENNWTTMQDDADYWGSFTLSNHSMTFSDRSDVVARARDLQGRDIGYPIVGTLNTLNYHDNPGTTIEPAEISQLRCDGLIEYCYESHDLDVWGANGANYDISVTANVESHNDFYDDPFDPDTELAPTVQCGIAGGTSTNMTVRSVYEAPELDFSYSLDGNTVHASISATDKSGIHYIGYKIDGAAEWQYSPTQAQHPTSDTYVFDLSFDVVETAYIDFFAVDNGNNYQDVAERVYIGIPECTVSPTTLSFSVANVGDSQTESFTITNSGYGTLSGIVSAIHAEFSASPGSYSLTAGQSVTINVTYSPSNFGDDLCDLTTGALCGDVSCSAVGPVETAACSLNTNTMLLQATAPTYVAVDQFTITNTSAANLAGSILVSDDAFVVEPTDYVIAPGASQPVQVTYTANGCGASTAVIDPGTDCGLISVEGHAGEFYVISLPANLLFDATDIGTGYSQTLTIQNSGCGSTGVNLSAEDFEGNPCPEFTIDPAYAIVGPGDTEIIVTYTPLDIGDDACSIVVAPESSVGVFATPNTVQCTADGPQPFIDVTIGALADPGSCHGVSWGDYDSDGDLDLFVANFFTDNKLLRNDGGDVFVDVAPPLLASGPRSTSGRWVDYDNDGDLDLYLANMVAGEGRLLQNDGNSNFSDVTPPLLAGEITIFHTAWADYDNDGDLDLYSADHSVGKLLRNDGGEDFVDVTPALMSGLGVSHSAAWADYDFDGYQDLYLILNTGDHLFRNRGDGTFEDATSESFGNLGRSERVVWGDFDNDEDLDLFRVNDYGGNTLFRNDGGGVFTNQEIGPLLGDTDDMDAASADYDNDGDLDICLANFHHGIKLLRNDGNFNFVDESPSFLSDTGDYGGVTWGDYDADGDVDLYMTTWYGGANRLLKNQAGIDRHWLQIQLEGVTSNRPGIGARIRIVASGKVQIHEVDASGGMDSHNSIDAEFGLGATTVIDTLQIFWPSGIRQELLAVPADQFLLIVESDPPSGIPDVPVPKSYSLYPCYPNPFNPRTTVRFDLPRTSRVRMSVYDIGGRLVRTLIDGATIDAGRQEIVWEGRDAAGRSVGAGVYFCQIEAGPFRETMRMTLLK